MALEEKEPLFERPEAFSEVDESLESRPRKARKDRGMQSPSALERGHFVEESTDRGLTNCCRILGFMLFHLSGLTIIIISGIFGIPGRHWEFVGGFILGNVVSLLSSLFFASPQEQFDKIRTEDYRYYFTAFALFNVGIILSTFYNNIIALIFISLMHSIVVLWYVSSLNPELASILLGIAQCAEACRCCCDIVRCVTAFL
jgi:hypothetical protein